MIIEKQAHARVGFMGNPSDGYFGKTISFLIKDFSARVTLWETPELEILPAQKDHSVFGSVDDMIKDVKLYGYYGGIRLIKATIKRFHDYCLENKTELPEKNFTIKYDTNIPRGVGLAGSSAIITATLKGLMEFYGVDIPKTIQPNLILETESQELGIAAGLQDRVIQVYGGLVYMDFNKKVMEKQGHGNYEHLNSKLLPKLFIAYRSDLAEDTDIFHNNIRARFERGDTKVMQAMKEFASYALKAKDALLEQDLGKIGPLMDKNFDTRAGIYKLRKKNVRLIEIARELGAHAKFTGSGGAVVGTYQDSKLYNVLRRAYTQEGFKIFKPSIM